MTSKLGFTMTSTMGILKVISFPSKGDYHGQIIEVMGEDTLTIPKLYSWQEALGEWIQLSEDGLHGGDNIVYQNDNPMPISIGGYSAGTTFHESKTIIQILDGLLYPYVQPNVSLSSNPNGSYQEFGTNISSIQLNSNIAKKSSNIVKMEYYKNGSLINTNNSPNSSGGNDSYIDNTGINNTTTYYSKVYDDKPNSVNSNSITFTYVYPMYIGSTINEIPTELDVKSMNKRITGKGNQSLSYTISASRFCFAFPSNYGNLTSIKDPNNFEMLNTFNKTTSDFTMLDGKFVNYNIYTLNAPTTQTAFNITYIF